VSTTRIALSGRGREPFLPPATPPPANTRSLVRELAPVVALAFVVGGVAVAIAYHTHTLLAYSDASSHLFIARRVLDSRTPSFAQLGTVWLPLPHVLLMLFVYSDFLWRTGLAGSAVGIPCLAITCSCTYLSVLRVTNHRAAAWTAVIALLANLNVLYVHTTALTEPVLLAALSATAYFLLKWAQTQANLTLITAALLAGLGIFTRYEAWAFSVMACALVALIAHSKVPEPARSEGLTLAFAVPPVYAAGLWLFYNWLIFGDPLSFARGAGSAFATTTIEGSHMKGNLALSLSTYSWAALDTLGWPMLGLGAAGLLCYLIRTRLRPDTLVPLLFVALFGVQVALLFLGQTDLTTPQSQPPGYYNVRYSFVLIPGVAFFVGYLASVAGRLIPRVLAAAVISLGLAAFAAIVMTGLPRGVDTLREGLQNMAARPLGLPLYLRSHYDGGGILLDERNSEFVTEAGIPVKDYIGTFNGQLFLNALRDPSALARWVIYDKANSSDQVAVALSSSVVFHSQFRLAKSFGTTQIYRRIA